MAANGLIGQIDLNQKNEKILEDVMSDKIELNSKLGYYLGQYTFRYCKKCNFRLENYFQYCPSCGVYIVDIRDILLEEDKEKHDE